MTFLLAGILVAVVLYVVLVIIPVTLVMWDTWMIARSHLKSLGSRKFVKSHSDSTLIEDEKGEIIYWIDKRYVSFWSAEKDKRYRSVKGGLWTDVNWCLHPYHYYLLTQYRKHFKKLNL